MRRVAVLFVASSVAVWTACSGDGGPSSPHGGAPRIGTAKQSIINGGVSGEDQNAVLYLGGLAQCSGTLIAPTLVLTARHCLTHWTVANNRFLDCSPGRNDTVTVMDTIDPARIPVYVGNTKPLDQEAAIGKAIAAAPTLNLCSSDVAVLVLDRPITGVAPKPLRLRTPTQKGESVLQIGWGLDENAKEPKQRKQRSGVVVALGPTQYQPPGDWPSINVPEGHVYTDTGGCTGDSGGPLLAATTGAIIGTFFYISTFDQTQAFNKDAGAQKCIDSVSGFSLLPQGDSWLTDLFKREGYTPWLEGRPRPQAIGATCSLPYDCESGFCFTAGATSVCSKRCDDGVCPAGYECIGGEGNRQCAPPLVAAPPGDATTSGCTTAGGSARARLAAMLLGLAALAASIRRRKK